LKTLTFFINTNIIIACAAVSLALATPVQLGLQPQFSSYLLVIFFAALTDYNFHRFIAVYKNPEAIHTEKYRWAAGHLALLKAFIVVSFAGLIVSLFFVRIEVLFLLGPLAVLTFLYSVTFSGNRKNGFRLQKIPGLKIVLIALVWSAATVLVPALSMGADLFRYSILLVFAERFTFIFAIAIPFDIRDSKVDALKGIKSIPVVLGENKALLICNIAMLLYLVIAGIHYRSFHLDYIIPAYAVSIASVNIFINSKKLRNLPFYYHGILDGSIILQGLLIFLSYYFRL